MSPDTIIYDLQHIDGRKEKTLLENWKQDGDRVFVKKRGEPWFEVRNSVDNMHAQSVAAATTRPRTRKSPPPPERRRAQWSVMKGWSISDICTSKRYQDVAYRPHPDQPPPTRTAA